MNTMTRQTQIIVGVTKTFPGFKWYVEAKGFTPANARMLRPLWSKAH